VIEVISRDDVDHLTVMTMQGKIKGFFKRGNTVYTVSTSGVAKVFAHSTQEPTKKKTKRGRR